MLETDHGSLRGGAGETVLRNLGRKAGGGGRIRFRDSLSGTPSAALNPEILRREIARYDAEDAAAVCARVRGEAGLQKAAGHWEQLYENVIAEFREATTDRHSEELALADYLRRWSYESRIRWEYVQIDKLRRIPVLGNTITAFGQNLLRRLARRQT